MAATTLAQLAKKKASIQLAIPYHSRKIEEAVISVLRSGRLISGPVVADFEAKVADYLGVKHVITVSSGTAALHLAFMVLGVGPGDEIITTPFSFVSSVNAILYCGATPVFADIDPHTFNIDPKQLEALITPRTVGIEPVHLYGQPAEMDEILSIARRHNLFVVEDAAQSIGAIYKGRKIGSIGDLSCFSTYCTKNLHTMEGGFITTNDDELARKLRIMRNVGQDGKYNHVMPGYNYRMTEVQAAIGREQLPLIEDFTQKRIQNATFLSEGLADLPGIITPYFPPYVRHAFHQYTIRVIEEEAGISRDELAQTLKAAGIETAVHYPRPIYEQPYYAGHRPSASCICPTTERVRDEILSLPVHPALSAADLTYIVETIREIIPDRAQNLARSGI